MSALCDKILAMDKRIGFAMVANLDGEILESRMLGTPLMSKEAVAGFAGIMGGDYPGNRSSDGGVFWKVGDSLAWL
jgi:hypothetical protein